jgi:diadenosine tetraphosphate (Ap4A) HIT family hydrolase
MTYQLVPATVIEEGRLWTLAVNANQNLLGKTMLVARRPVESVTDLTEAEWLDLRSQMARVTTAVAALWRPDQFNHAFLMNVDAQVHLHVVPRYRGVRTWRGRTFADPHWGELYGKEQNRLPDEDLAAVAAAVRARLS